MRKERLVTLFSTLAISALPIHAQTKVSMVPISGDVVVLRVTVDQASPARVASLNGGLIRLAVRNGPTLALSPALREGGVAVAVMEILANPTTGSESVRQLGKLFVTSGSSSRYDDAKVSLEIGLIEIRPPAVSGTGGALGPCTICCLTCGDLTACACAVEMDCGKCCCPAGGCGCGTEGRPSPEAVSNSDSAAISPGCVVTRSKRQSH